MELEPVLRPKHVLGGTTREGGNKKNNNIVYGTAGHHQRPSSCSMYVHSAGSQSRLAVQTY